MTSVSAVSARIIDWWGRNCLRWHPVWLIVVTWALLTLPLVFFRGYNSDEGVAVTIARSALEDGDWLTPHLFNTRFVERPTLLSWIIAALSAPLGHVSQITARLPIALFLLGGCLAIFALLRKAASPAASLLGAALFLACPLVFRSYVMITADMPLAVLLFAAFLLWWDGHASGRVSLARWVVIGIVLALAGLMKGPQPIAYFALGVGLFVLLAPAWREVPGLVLAGLICAVPLAAWYWYVFATGDETQWAAFMRLRPGAVLPGPLHSAVSLIANAVPAALLAGALLIDGEFRQRERMSRHLVWALVSYGSVATLIVLFWPGGSAGRYFLPMVLPLAALGGLAYDALAARRPPIVALGIVATLCVLGYAVVYSVVAAPLLPDRFRSTKIAAERIAELVHAAPAPIYRTGPVGMNVLPYVPGRIYAATVQSLASKPGPAWFAVTKPEAEKLIAARPDLRVALSVGDPVEWQLLRADK